MAREPQRRPLPALGGEVGAARSQTVEVEGRQLSLTNLDKVLYPATGFTKGQVIDYYARIAPVMLPHLAARPLTMRRFPGGVDDPNSFYEKHRPRSAPPWVRSERVLASPKARDRNGVDFVILDDLATMVWVANLASIELHVPQWKVAKRGGPEVPDLLVFDLDPGPPASIVQCAEVALIVAEEVSNTHGWRCLPKTSGSKGLQLYVRLPESDRQRGWDDGGSKELAHSVASELARAHPDLIVSNMKKELRRGKVLIDWSQNHVAKTTIAPYSLRARREPTVSAPVDWDEIERLVSRGKAERLSFLPDEVIARVAERGDLFSSLLR
ncbi:MAG: non-homologous end-joining DNA ligase [Acidimicrobiales bacterium]